ncbi:MAG: helix-turn-helix domain-containing protein, partial [Bdellovibrionales bacterium]|nr:helix-turn-helix domain-containing protein [Bdellovibrionales bacterium]
SPGSPQAAAPAVPAGGSPIDRLKSMQEGSASAFGAARPTAARARHVENPEMEKEIAETALVNGAFLKKVREYKGVSPEEIMDILKISKNYLAALEEDVVEKLPAGVFVRGFVIQYAKALKLDPDRIAARYMEFLRQRRG